MSDAIAVKIRDGAVANRPVYVVVRVNVDGERDVLGMWVGTGDEGANGRDVGGDRTLSVRRAVGVGTGS